MREFKRRPVTEYFSLPPELLPDVPKVTLSGGSEVLVENHGGLKSYSRDLIEVRGRSALVQVRGEDLEIAAMTKTEIIIQGIIVAVELG